MNKAASGEFVQLDEVKGKDEIGQLSRHFTYMVDSISSLMKENDRMHDKEKSLIIAGEQIRFEMLASQINPHFLFNVLESLRMKAHVDGNEDIAEIVWLLGKLMRRSLERTDDFITIREELEFVAAYMRVQKFRFDDRFTFTIDMDESLGGHKILPLLLQPLVENAVVHGMEGVDGDGFVGIRIFFRAQSLILEVEDNGIGIPAMKLGKIQQAMMDREAALTGNHRMGHHIGLMNVNERIKLRYGKSYGLDLESERGNGTVATIVLPLEVEGI